MFLALWGLDFLVKICYSDGRSNIYRCRHEMSKGGSSDKTCFKQKNFNGRNRFFCYSVLLCGNKNN